MNPVHRRVQIPWKPVLSGIERFERFVKYGVGKIYAPMLNAREALPIVWWGKRACLVYSPYREGFGRDRVKSKPKSQFLLLHDKHPVSGYVYLKAIEAIPVHKYKLVPNILTETNFFTYKDILSIYKDLLSENIESYICSKEDYDGYVRRLASTSSNGQALDVKTRK